jgi:hypothetical protein
VLGSSEHGSEATSSKIRGILDCLRDHQLSREVQHRDAKFDTFMLQQASRENMTTHKSGWGNLRVYGTCKIRLDLPNGRQYWNRPKGNIL